MYVFVKRSGQPRGMSKLHEFIEKADGGELSRTLSEREKLDILHDGSRDPERRRISGVLASKLPNDEVLDAIDKMNRWKDKAGIVKPGDGGSRITRVKGKGK